MGILYFIVALLLWMAIGYCFYRVVRSVVVTIKKFIAKRKESKNHENSQC